MLILSGLTGELMSPGAPGPLSAVAWPTHCLVMIGLSACLIALSVVSVRQAARNQAAASAQAEFG